ncbi:hypothetical protein K502DRAFT_323050 [Neoconidiobolus thromboides FSU 785]|nr:hypothetical protein K502DRAFT_323050 [Neoconidiobolus thromboides FSU 785]
MTLIEDFKKISKGILIYSKVLDIDEEIMNLYTKNFEEKEFDLYPKFNQRDNLHYIEIESFSINKLNTLKSKLKKTDFTNIIELQISQNNNLLNQTGITGSVIWKSSFLLSKYLLSIYTLFEGKNVLELGTGTGIVGITLSKLLVKKKVNFELILTDQEILLSQIQKNMALNGLDKVSNVHCKEFSWDTITENKITTLNNFNQYHWIQQYSTGFDIILLSDLIYNENVNLLLVNTIKLLLTINSQAVLLIAQELRAAYVIEEFISLLFENNICLERAIFNDNTNLPNNIVIYLGYLNKKE